MTGFFLLIKGREAPHFFEIDIYDDRMEIYSPGGMPDGSIIQDKDPLTVPSTRRNPVLADIFNRLWDIWNVKVVDLEKSSAAMNFRTTMTKVKSRLLDQFGISLQL